MREDDYTGSKIEDDDEIAGLIEDGDLYEFDEDDADFVLEDDENEMTIDIASVADGARSLRDIAELLYDLADELLALSADGWEILDDISCGNGIAVRIDVDTETDDG